MSRRRAVPLAAAVVAAALATIPVAGAGSGLTGALWSDSVTFDTAISVMPDPGDRSSVEVIAQNPLCWTAGGNRTLEFDVRVVAGGFTHLWVEVGGITGPLSGQHYLRVAGTSYNVAGNMVRTFGLDTLSAYPSGDIPVELVLHQSASPQAYLVIRLSNADGSITSEQVVQVGPTSSGNCVDFPAGSGTAAAVDDGL